MSSFLVVGFQNSQALYIVCRISKEDALCSVGLQLLPLVRLDMHIAGAAKDSEVDTSGLDLCQSS